MGSLDVLSAVIVGCMMLSAIVYVSTFDAPETSARENVDQLLERSAQDFLRIYDEWPLADRCNGNTMLERFLIDGLNDDDREWNRRTATHFSMGTDMSLLLDNGEGIYPLQERWKTIGSTYDITFQPDWDYVVPVVATDSVDGTSAFVADVFGTRHSTMLSARGENVEMGLGFSTAAGPGAIQSNSLTAVVSEASPGRVTSPLWWLDSKGDVESSVQFQHRDLLDNFVRTFRIHLGSSADLTSASISPGFVIEVALPQEWTVDNTSDDYWNQSFAARSESTEVVRFTALTEIQMPTDLTFRATPPSDIHRPFDIITARALNGSLSETHLPVLYAIEAEADLPRELLPITTYPVERGATSLFGATFVNGGAEVTVDSFDIRIPGGYDLEYNDGQGAMLFAEPASQPAMYGTVRDGTWTWFDERHLHWEPSDARDPLVVPHGGVASWIVELPINASEDLQTSIEPRSSEGAVASLSFENGFEARSSVWGPTPGLVRVRVPPDDLTTTEETEGYPWTPDSSGVTHAFDIEARLPWATVSGEGSYTLNPAAAETVDMDSAVASASFRVKDRLAPLGSFVQVDADLQSIMTELSSSGIESTTLKVDMYAPPSMGCKPTKSISLDQSTLPTSASRGVALADVEGLGGSSLFAVNEDGHGYRIDGVDAGGIPLETAAQRWATALPASGTAIAIAEWQPGAPRVIAGDSGGQATLIDARDGTVLGAPISVGIGEVVAIVPDEDAQAFVTATALGDVRLVRADGTVAGSWLEPVLEGSREAPRLSWSSDGHVIAMTPTEIYKLTAPDLETMGQVSLKAFAAAQSGSTLRLLAVDGLYELDLASFSGLHRVEEQSLLTATAADLDGDGTRDLVGVDPDMTLRLWNGATGALSWRSASVPEHVGDTEALLIAADRPDYERRCAETQVDRYTFEPSCELAPPSIDATGELDHVYALAANADGVTYGYRWHGVTRLASIDADGTGRFDVTVKEGVLPVAVARGHWGASRAAALSGDDGIVRVYDAEDSTTQGDVLYQGSPSRHTGRFSMFIPVPEGGFYGAHLLVATLSWEDTESHSREARLTDWFTVVGSDRKPVIEPAYRIVLVVGFPDAVAKEDDDEAS